MIRALAVLLTCFALPAPAEAQQLLMFEERGCIWCARWDEEVGQIYAKTDEGRQAPLRRIDIHDPLPEELGAVPRITYTPTFVLFHEGAELGRIEGYPGEEFFWGLLGMILDDLEKEGAS